MNTQFCVDCQHCIFSEICQECMFTQSVPAFTHALQRRVQIRQGQCLFTAGEEVKHLIAVRSGCFTVVDEDKTLLAVYTPGQLIGGENLYHSYYRTTAIAVQDAEVCMIDYSAMYGLSQLTLGTFSHTIKLLSETADDNLKMIKVLLQHDAFKKVAMFILLMSERNKAKSFSAMPFSLPLQQKEIASLLGITASTLRRSIARLEAEKCISLQSRKILINDAEMLRNSTAFHSKSRIDQSND
ncbi:Crp/Fnr family transcriptional regulator [Enterobacter sp. 9-2]|nr:Crp/Fnr family transcriptional regulator [Enterobacter sp. 9-2]